MGSDLDDAMARAHDGRVVRRRGWDGARGTNLKQTRREKGGPVGREGVGRFANFMYSGRS